MFYKTPSTMNSYKFLAFLTFFLSTCCLSPSNAQNSCHTANEIIYSDTVDALHYDIHLTGIDMTSKILTGYTTVMLKPKVAGLDKIRLELVRLAVDSVFVNDLKINEFTHQDPFLTIPIAPVFGTSDTINVRVYYRGQPFVDPSGWGGFHFAGDYAFNLGVGFDAIPHNLGKAWFPCIDDFRDRALYDVYITVPSGKTAISGGLLKEVIDNGNNTSTWHWRTNFSLPTYLISASIGNYSLISDVYNGMNGPVPITYYCRPSDTSRVEGTFIHMKDIMQVFETHFGPYPLERVGFTATANGAMEHAANVSYPYSGWNGNTSMEWWYAHELSHMWFGDAITCASAEDMWLNEGWAVWCESLVFEYLYGKEVAKEYLRLKLKEVILQTHIKDGGYFAVYGIPQTITYGNTVYEKGCQVTHTLRHYLGDELFFNGVKAYLEEFAYKPASTCDLRDFLSSHTGVDLEDFFNAWVFAPGFLNFSVNYMQVEPGSQGFDATVSVRQRLHEAPDYANSNHLELTFIGPQWQRFTDTIIFSGPNGQKTFRVPFEPIDVIADLDEKISDAALSYDAVIRTADEQDFKDTYCKVITTEVTDSAWVRVTHNWVGPEAPVTPIPGMMLSDARYWKVEGIFPGSYKAKGKFFYNKNTLDKNLLSGTIDSLLILYRKDGLSEWQGVRFTKMASNAIGYITVDSLAKGEYTLAVYDKSYGFSEPGKSGDYRMNLYPNPSDGHCMVDIDAPFRVELGIYDSLGRQMQKVPFEAGEHLYRWNKVPQGKGIYYFRLFTPAGNELVSRKMVFK